MPKTMKTNTFPIITDNDWERVARKSLKGRSLASLQTETYEGVTLKPLYTKAILEEEVGEKHETLLAAIRAQKRDAAWTIAQCSYADSAEEYIREMQQLLASGNEAVVYDGSHRLDWTDETVQELANLIRTYPVYAWNVASDDRFVDVFSLIPEEERQHVTGIVSSRDELPNHFGHVRTELVNIVPAHLRGADAVFELALSLAYAEDAAREYASFDELLRKIAVRFAVDTHFFIELAKLRAFRVLWNMFCSAYDVHKGERIPVIVETSLRSYTKMDPYVNMLRSGNEAFAAVLGGADVLTVHPHSVLTEVNEVAARYAKNIQLVIREETFANKVVDPAGGSYFIDTLTNELIERAWELFLTIVDVGGVQEYEASGALAERLEKTRSKRLEHLFTRKSSLIGTNIYADPDEIIDATERLEVTGRLAKPYERLRLAFQANKPKVSLLAFGELKDAKPLFDFVTGFIAPCGVAVREEKLFQTVAEMTDWLNKASDDYSIVCFPPSIEQSFKENLCVSFPRGKWVDVAQMSFTEEEKERWKEAGVAGFYYRGKHQLTKLEDVYRRWERLKGGDVDDET